MAAACGGGDPIGAGGGAGAGPRKAGRTELQAATVSPTKANALSLRPIISFRRGLPMPQTFA